MLRIFICCLFCVTMVQSLSFLSRLQLHNFEGEKFSKWKLTKGNEFNEKSCVDEIEEELCSSYEKYCSTQKFVQEKCPRTCKICQKALSEPLCKESLFGCCWDNFTIAVGPEKICPPCADRGIKCQLMIDRCNEFAVRKICPETCGIKCEKCEDDIHQAKACPLFKKIGACKTDPHLMKKYCKKTCHLC